MLCLYNSKAVSVYQSRVSAVFDMPCVAVFTWSKAAGYLPSYKWLILGWSALVYSNKYRQLLCFVPVAMAIAKAMTRSSETIVVRFWNWTLNKKPVSNLLELTFVFFSCKVVRVGVKLLPTYCSHCVANAQVFCLFYVTSRYVLQTDYLACILPNLTSNVISNWLTIL